MIKFDDTFKQLVRKSGPNDRQGSMRPEHDLFCDQVIPEPQRDRTNYEVNCFPLSATLLFTPITTSSYRDKFFF